MPPERYSGMHEREAPWIRVTSQCRDCVVLSGISHDAAMDLRLTQRAFQNSVTLKILQRHHVFSRPSKIKPPTATMSEFQLWIGVSAPPDVHQSQIKTLQQTVFIREKRPSFVSFLN